VYLLSHHCNSLQACDFSQPAAAGDFEPLLVDRIEIVTRGRLNKTKGV
jgi:hypothetical protein